MLFVTSGFTLAALLAAKGDLLLLGRSSPCFLHQSRYYCRGKFERAATQEFRKLCRLMRFSSFSGLQGMSSNNVKTGIHPRGGLKSPQAPLQAPIGK